jgi:hypothetical protein
MKRAIIFALLLLSGVARAEPITSDEISVVDGHMTPGAPAGDVWLRYARA